jgi:hypothetical protein
LNFKRFTLKQGANSFHNYNKGGLLKERCIYFFRLPLYRFTAFSFYKVENLLLWFGMFSFILPTFPTFDDAKVQHCFNLSSIFFQNFAKSVLIN